MNIPAYLVVGLIALGVSSFTLEPLSPKGSIYYLVLKRLMDIIVTSLILVCAVPLMVVVAMTIKLEDGGPIFYRSKRVGQWGRPFTLYKFRSMRPDAPLAKAGLEHLNEKDGPVFKIRHDPRITRVGRVIRKYSIDELPQIWNILQGDMSLVGPRPPLPEEVAKYSEREIERLSVRPGMTSLYVVAGRSDLTFEQWVQLDLSYIRNRSIIQDLRILLKSVPRILRGAGAY